MKVASPAEGIVMLASFWLCLSARDGTRFELSLPFRGLCLLQFRGIDELRL